MSSWIPADFVVYLPYVRHCSKCCRCITSRHLHNITLQASALLKNGGTERWPLLLSPSLGGHSFLGEKFWSFSCCSEMLYHILNPSLLLGLVLHILLFYPLDLSDFPFSSDFFKITAILRENPHTVKFTILKCLIQWFQYNRKVMRWSTLSDFKTLSPSPQKPHTH